jgi:FkbM family methyltransferase
MATARVPLSLKARRLATDAAYRREWRELRRLSRLEPYTRGESELPGCEVSFSHPQAFVAQYRQMWQDRVYAARLGPAPVILDVGANYAMAAIVLKQDHPQAEIIAFEADPGIADLAEANIAAAGLDGVTLVRAAAWTEAGTMRFSSEGGDAGHLGDEGGIDVPTVRLRDYLDRDIDLLKMDIEGAEVDVILDCADRLGRVRNLVCEYHSYSGRPQRLGELLAAIEGAGLRVIVQHDMTPSHPLVSVPTDPSGMDMRLNIWAYKPE